MDDTQLMEIYNEAYYDSLLNNKAPFNPADLLVSHIPGIFPKIPMKPVKNQKTYIPRDEKWENDCEVEEIYVDSPEETNTTSRNKYKKIEELLEDVQIRAKDLNRRV